MFDLLDSTPISSPDALIQIAQRGHVRVLTLNRPTALNSFTQDMHAELRAALDAAAGDSDVRAVLITGAGRGFCAGQDLNDPGMAAGADGKPDIAAVIEKNYRPLAMRIQAMPVPVVCAVNGVAAGAGANFAFCCDIVLAARSASFIQAFSRIGLIPDCGGTWLLPRLAGRARALALTLTGDKLSAADAERFGLIWQVVDDADLQAQAFALAMRLAAQPSKALVATRQALDASQSLSLADALSLEARVQGELGRAHDFAEGVAAFQQKRPAVFKDR
ncbi:enoyl-CoA hydratase-related protein [Scleromatobacter humisilvae]|uniref:2-(1,2-epoxy-1,2-dihydrophenyl)acetyl-CoA isomerase PaaG n=1 Tax=Scleromatobacter humisilvae TaxID=2897159 RepID=A0A9X1YEP8_9BURK|nr:enoyl-CoA hydratase-related protein [Scleromatobacter humisilvae]MCK9684536.1 2-(1,2-epoxy-1,2-dihydrophenyl)acetyl-CoA isomerase PaaG [Scleromatobacter humisilvae]